MVLPYLRSLPRALHSDRRMPRPGGTPIKTLSLSLAWLPGGLLEVLSIDPAGNTDILSRMFVQDHIDNLGVRSNRVVRDLDDVPDELFTSFLRKTDFDVAFDERHNISPSDLFKTFNQFFIVRGALNVLWKMLAMFNEIDSTSLANHEKDVILRFTCRGADHPE
jgi:hypothetical protein